MSEQYLTQLSSEFKIMMDNVEEKTLFAKEYLDITGDVEGYNKLMTNINNFWKEIESFTTFIQSVITKHSQN